MSDNGTHLRIISERSDKPSEPDDPDRQKVETSATMPPGASSRADAKIWKAADWDDLVPRLLLLAMSRISRMTWRGHWASVPPGAAEAEDFVNDAITKTIAGVRAWRQENCTLFQHLAGVVVSDISHAAQTTENKLTLADDGRDRAGGWPPDRADERPDQEEQALWRSEQRRLLGHLDEVDPKIARMAELILIDDIDGSVALAERLNCTTNEVANLRKRMKRALQAFLLAGEGKER